MHQTGLPAALTDIEQLRPARRNKIRHSDSVARRETMGRHAGGFVEREERCIFVNDRDIELPRRRRPLGQSIDRSGKNQIIAGRQPVAFLAGSAVEQK